MEGPASASSTSAPTLCPGDDASVHVVVSRAHFPCHEHCWGGWVSACDLSTTTRSGTQSLRLFFQRPSASGSAFLLDDEISRRLIVRQQQDFGSLPHSRSTLSLR